MRVNSTIVASAVVCLAAGSSLAAKSKTTPQIDPQATSLLKQMSDYLSHLSSFRVESNTIDEKVTTHGQKVQFPATSEVSVRRPNAIRVDRAGPSSDVVFRYDGKRFTVFGEHSNYWAEAPAPATIDQAVDVARDRYGIEAPAADLIVKDPYRDLMDGVQSASYLGLESVEGVRCHHLAFRGQQVDWQIWIEDGARPLPRRYTITSKRMKAQPQFTVTLSHWELNPRLSEDLFTFRPPADATRIAFSGQARQRLRQGRR